MSAKHTPGPWKTSGIYIMAGGHCIASCDTAAGNTTDEIDEANARLIAAAPDLLAELKRSAEGWANAIELGLIPAQHIPAATIMRDDARAALSKAGATI